MDILINNGKELQYGSMSMNEEGIRKKEEAEAKILAARTKNARYEFQNLLDTAIDSLAGSNRPANDVAPDELDEIFDEASETYGVEKQLLLAVARTESNFRASATSGSGAMGIMQLMPETAEEMGVDDAYDPYDNIMGGAKLLSILLDRYDGDKSRALAAYNAGGNAVDSYGGVPPMIQGYVNKVMSYYSGGIRIPDSVSDRWNASSDVAEDLKTAFSKFPEHQSYNAFLQELSEEMHQNGQPSDADQAYQMLMSSARTAIERVKEDLEDSVDTEDYDEDADFGDS